MAGKHAEIKSTVAIPDTVGQVDGAAIAEYLISNCGKGYSDDETWFSRQVHAAPPTSKALRVEQLQSHGKHRVCRTRESR